MNTNVFLGYSIFSTEMPPLVYANEKDLLIAGVGAGFDGRN